MNLLKYDASIDPFPDLTKDTVVMLLSRLERRQLKHIALALLERLEEDDEEEDS